MTKARFSLYAWIVLAFHLSVILWGAFVRASGSGAGCGDRWPLCNGQVIPTAPVNATIIEFGHRLTSGLALLLVAVLAIWAFRAFPSGHAIRRSAVLALTFTLLEAAIGAGLVLLRLVASNESLARGAWLSMHLVNTLLLLAALAVTAWFSSQTRAVIPAFMPVSRAVLGFAIAGFLLTGITGGLAALGDTLFVSTSLADSLRRDFSASAPMFVRLRILHPIAAGALGAGLLMLAYRVLASKRASLAAQRLAGTLAVLVLCQLSLGCLDIVLKTPIWLQILHLLTADLVWLSLILLSTECGADLLPAQQSTLDHFPHVVAG